MALSGIESGIHKLLARIVSHVSHPKQCIAGNNTEAKRCRSLPSCAELAN